ncbi:MAG: tetratricopeptide repeat protein [Terracidiphilus sp.]|jgi:tetratricopeptide (TPR) repeat protein
MRKLDPYRRFSALATLLAIASLSQVGFPQPAAEAPDSSQRASQTVAVESAQPTPEEVGDALMIHQRYQAAIEAYKKAPSDSAVVMNKLGIAYQLMFNFQDALRCYKASVRLDPDSPFVYNNLGTIYDGLEQYRAAERMYRKALSLDPGSPLVLRNLGSDLLAQHKYKEGWESYQAALTKDPKIFEERPTALRVTNPASLTERGAMNYYMAKGCLRAGMTSRAIEYLRMALNEGFTSPKKIAADNEFAGLRGVPAFEQLLAAQSNP